MFRNGRIPAATINCRGQKEEVARLLAVECEALNSTTLLAILPALSANQRGTLALWLSDEVLELRSSAPAGGACTGEMGTRLEVFGIYAGDVARAKTWLRQRIKQLKRLA